MTVKLLLRLSGWIILVAKTQLHLTELTLTALTELRNCLQAQGFNEEARRFHSVREALRKARAAQVSPTVVQKKKKKKTGQSLHSE